MKTSKSHKKAALLSLGAFSCLASLWAQTPPRIMRLAPDGPDGKGLSEPLAKVSTYSGEKAYTYRYYQSPNSKESAGIWASKSAHDGMHRATNTEVFYLSAGRVTLQDKSGREETFQAGDAVLLPRGAEFSWKRSEDVKEYFAVFDFDPPAGKTAANPDAEPTFVKLDPNKALTIPSLGGHGYSYYSSASGASVGVWETDGVESKKFGMATHTELMVIIGGAVTLSSPDGKSQTFKAGDVALVPRGAQSKWSSGKIRKFYVTFDYEPSAHESARK
ncbi:MAG: cupin domain-containing protein [Bryobacteraceae bacterium]